MHRYIRQKVFVILFVCLSFIGFGFGGVSEPRPYVLGIGKWMK
jgi:hypothetical protein